MIINLKKQHYDRNIENLNETVVNVNVNKNDILDIDGTRYLVLHVYGKGSTGR